MWKTLYVTLIIFLFSRTLYSQTINTLLDTTLFGVPNGICIGLNGEIFVGSTNHFVFEINNLGVLRIIAGTGVAGYNGDNISATAAQLYSPGALAIDKYNNLYIGDIGNNRIRKINSLTGIITTVAGNGIPGYSGDHYQATSAELHSPKGLQFDHKGNLYILDNSNFRIRKLDTSGIIITVAGNGISGSTGNGGPATSASICVVSGITFDSSGNLYVADGCDYTIRKIDSFGFINIFAGDSGSYLYSSDGIPPIGCSMSPLFLAFNQQNTLFIADAVNHRIRFIDNLGYVQTCVGTGFAGYSGNGGPATSAQIDHPDAIAFDSCGNLFFNQAYSPGCIRKVTFNPSCGPLIAQEIIEEHISIYPNPATEILNIDGAKGGEEWVLLNILGNIEQSGMLHEGNNEIPIKYLPPGMKLSEIIAPNGEVTVKKFVKE